MTVQLDTNILARLAEPAHPQYARATRATARIAATSREMVIVPQNLYEFWVVATRPTTRNGLGMTPAQADTEVRAFRRRYRLLVDPPTLVDDWVTLLVTYGVSGKPAHDARLVAAMCAHLVPEILTFNVADFARYHSLITVLDPMVIAP